MRRLALSLLLVAACSRGEPSSTGATGTGSTPAPALAPPPPSFRGTIAPNLAGMCARAPGCHGEQPTIEVSLDLRAGASYRALVGAPAEARKGALRVDPGHPERSFLVDKLRGKLAPGEGKRMPLDPNTGVSIANSSMGDSYVENILAPWIRAGARQN